MDNTREYLDNYGMALIAERYRRKDHILEDWLASADHQRVFYNPEDKHYIFRNEYLQVVGKQGGSFERLFARLKVIRPGKVPYWSCSIETCVYELPHRSSPEDSTNAVFELSGDEVELDSRSLPSIVSTN